VSARPPTLASVAMCLCLLTTRRRPEGRSWSTVVPPLGRYGTGRPEQNRKRGSPGRGLAASVEIGRETREYWGQRETADGVTI
jgi:hypothetical protein